jgi:hypothetical protein
VAVVNKNILNRAHSVCAADSTVPTFAAISLTSSLPELQVLPYNRSRLTSAQDCAILFVSGKMVPYRRVISYIRLAVSAHRLRHRGVCRQRSGQIHNSGKGHACNRLPSRHPVHCRVWLWPTLPSFWRFRRGGAVVSWIHKASNMPRVRIIYNICYYIII